jgi:hypothetical protein
MCALKTLTDGCVQIQCQMWLDNILRDLLEAKQSADDQVKRESHEINGP